MKTSSVDLIITSPPYNIGKEYERRQPLDTYLDWIRPIAAECVRVLRPGGSLCWQVGQYVRDGEVFPLDLLFYPMFTELGLSLRARMFWQFGHGLHCKRRFSGRHESIMWFTKGTCRQAARIRAGFYEDGGVWKITNVKHNHPEKTAHPCQFPERLVERLLLALSRQGDLVLDPFGGSGTVGVSAKRHGRAAVLIDLDESYCAIARDRISKTPVGIKVWPLSAQEKRHLAGDFRT